MAAFRGAFLATTADFLGDFLARFLAVCERLGEVFLVVFFADIFFICAGLADFASFSFSSAVFSSSPLHVLL